MRCTGGHMDGNKDVEDKGVAGSGREGLMGKEAGT